MAQLRQTGLGESPLGAGIRLLPWTATPMVIAPIACALADCVGNRPFMVGGLVLPDRARLVCTAARRRAARPALALGTE